VSLPKASVPFAMGETTDSYTEWLVLKGRQLLAWARLTEWSLSGTERGWS